MIYPDDIPPLSPFWQKRVAPLSEEEINEKVTRRIEFLEDRIRDHGLQLTCGAEQEFVDSNKRGEEPVPLNLDVVKAELAESGLHLVERVYKERHFREVPDRQTYEVVLGTVTNDFSSPHPASAVVAEIEQLHKLVPTLLEDDQSAISFAPSYPKGRLTAGIHMNYGLFDANGNNLFGNNKLNNNPLPFWRKKYTPFAEHCAAELVELQRQGLPLYGSDEAFYNRIGRYKGVPSHFGISRNKNETSVNLRVANRRGAGDVPLEEAAKPPALYRGHSYHIEDRLPGADSNPCFVTLAGVGAIYHTLERLAAEQGGSFSSDKVRPMHAPENIKIPKDARMALETFRNSKLWDEIAGPELHQQLVDYLMAQQQSRSAQRTA